MVSIAKIVGSLASCISASCGALFLSGPRHDTIRADFILVVSRQLDVLSGSRHDMIRFGYYASCVPHALVPVWPMP